jgi:hypothetical protein
MIHRPHMPHATKFEACQQQGWRCACGCGAWLLWGLTQHDHRPPLMNRDFDPVTEKFTPDANDVKFIDALTTDCHKVKTFGPGGEKRITTRGGDIGEKAHEKSTANKHTEHLKAMASKQCGQPRVRKNTFGFRVSKVMAK